MEIELRQAGADPSTPPVGVVGIVSADSVSIRVRADLNGDGVLRRPSRPRTSPTRKSRRPRSCRAIPAQLKGAWSQPTLIWDRALNKQLLCIGTGHDANSAQANLLVIDPDGDSLHYELTQAPAGMTIASGGAIAWPLPPRDQRQDEYHVTVRATDPKGGSATQEFTLRVATTKNASK